MKIWQTIQKIELRSTNIYQVFLRQHTKEGTFISLIDDLGNVLNHWVWTTYTYYQFIQLELFIEKEKPDHPIQLVILEPLILNFTGTIEEF